MGGLMERIFGCRLWALIVKEVKEISRNRHLLFLLLFPPTIQLLILGAALDPQVRSVKFGVVDYDRSHDSRKLVDQITKNDIFPNHTKFKNSDLLGQEIERKNIDVGIVIPAGFGKVLNNEKPAPVQVLVDGADAYTSGIASSQIAQSISRFRPGDGGLEVDLPIKTNVRMIYNPDLTSSWHFVPGVLGAVLTLTATLVASAAILRERESGTMGQLLMTPAATWEILLAKVIPLAVFILIDVAIAITAAILIFDLPFRGSPLLFALSSTLYVLIGIGMGMLLGTMCKTQRQAQLSSFFINIPLIQLSGTVVPFDTMPEALQTLAAFDPLRYYAIAARGIILKGTGMDVLWPEIVMLTIFAILVLALSAVMFKRRIA